ERDAVVLQGLACGNLSVAEQQGGEHAWGEVRALRIRDAQDTHRALDYRGPGVIDDSHWLGREGDQHVSPLGEAGSAVRGRQRGQVDPARTPLAHGGLEFVVADDFVCTAGGQVTRV